MARSILPEEKIHPAVREKVASHGADILKEVRDAVAANQIVVVGMRQNPFPKKARKLLDDAGLAYKYLEYGSYLGQWRCRLVETPSGNYVQRTEWNVRDSDGTLIVNRGRLDGGTLLTAELALGRYRKPLLVVQLGRRIRGECFRAWRARNRVHVLNVAGPRESKRPGIYRAAKAVLVRLLGELVILKSAEPRTRKAPRKPLAER